MKLYFPFQIYLKTFQVACLSKMNVDWKHYNILRSDNTMVLNQDLMYDSEIFLFQNDASLALITNM